MFDWNWGSAPGPAKAVRRTRWSHSRNAFGLIAALGVLITACGPSASPSSPGVQGAMAGPPKILRIALQREPQTFGPFPGSEGSGPALAHDELVREMPDGSWVGQLGEAISTEKGTWVINPDGSMVTTWKLRPNVVWHDGTPFTSADMLFTYTLNRDADVGTRVQANLKPAVAASAPDPLTFEVRWSDTDVRANRAIGLTPLPRHILEDVYRSDKAAIEKQTYFNDAFTGLGPFRLTGWDRGTEMRFQRFDQYWRGPAAIDQIVLRFIADPTTMIANILSQDVDVVIPPGVDIAGATTLRERWAGTGNQVIIETNPSVNSAYYVQMRPQYARPSGPNGLLNRDVREALYRSIDRQGMADGITFGQAPLADSWIPVDHAVRREVGSSIPQFPFDPARAQQLFNQAGWERGPDGVLVQRDSGDRFEIEVSGQQRAIIEKQQLIIADDFKRAGAATNLVIWPASLNNDREYESTRSGLVLGSIGAVRFFYDRALHSSETTSDANRWSGRNKGGYANSESDRLIDALSSTIDERQRTELVRQAVSAQMRDLPIMPFFWEQDPVLALASVKIPASLTKLGFVWEWQKA
jgi:peptide/nickel transport system substrate-binding protein